MTTCLGKSCVFGELCVSLVGVDRILCALLSLFGIEGGVWAVIVLIPDQCLSIYFSSFIGRAHLCVCLGFEKN